MSTHETIEHLLALWDEQRQQGFDVPVEQLCAETPELLTALRDQIGRLQAMDWLDDSVDDASGSVDRPMTVSPHESPLGEASVPAVLGGRYEIQRLIAEGGFAQVWRALDTALQRFVAVKVTTVNCYAEARRVAQLKHHGIVTVHDVGNENGLCYIVFDLVEGSTLAERMQQGSISSQESARIVAEIAGHLHFAHNKGFIHRDIKPSNILIDENGDPVLADFGIAVTECELRHEVVTSVGTLAYMAPEQLQAGAQLDLRTDVYGLGVVFYELLTGRLPFVNPTLSRLRADILSAEPLAPRSLNPDIPERLERICLKCLSKEMNDRYSSAASLAEDLKTG